MQMPARELLADLHQRLAKVTQTVEGFKNLSPEQLNFKHSDTSWSILECLEHLNLYGDFYIPEVEKRILDARAPQTGFWARWTGADKPYDFQTAIFKSTWLGNYSANMMLPQSNGQIKKMSTFKDKNPIYTKLSPLVLDRFLKQQARWVELLKQAESVDLTRTKTAITLAWLKFRLGDTLRFVIFHIERHSQQAANVLSS
jgi:hypothetical protein